MRSLPCDYLSSTGLSASGDGAGLSQSLVHNGQLQSSPWGQAAGPAGGGRLPVLWQMVLSLCSFVES